MLRPREAPVPAHLRAALENILRAPIGDDPRD